MNNLTNLDKLMIAAAILFFGYIGIDSLGFFSGDKGSKSASKPVASEADMINGQKVAPQHRSYVALSKFSTAYAEVSTIRMMMQEHYMDKGEYPRSLSDMRLDNNMDTGKYIQSIKIQSEGKFRVNLREEHFGAGSFYTMEPVDYMGGTSTRWECKTNVVINHPSFSNMCESL